MAPKPITADQPRRTTVWLGVSDDERRALEATASRRQISTSDLIRAALEQHLGAPLVDLARAHRIEEARRTLAEVSTAKPKRSRK